MSSLMLKRLAIGPAHLHRLFLPIFLLSLAAAVAVALEGFFIMLEVVGLEDIEPQWAHRGEGLLLNLPLH